MDIAALSTVNSMGKIQGQVSIAVASQIKKMTEQNGQNLVKMMEHSIKPHVGGNIDVKA